MRHIDRELRSIVLRLGSTWLPAIAISAGLAVGGCAGNRGGQTEAPEDAAPIAYPNSLSAASTPSEVAQVLIQALDAKDKQTLMGLAATETETAAIDEIYRKHGRSRDTKPEEAARLTAAGWQATYAFFEKGATYVTEERMEPAGAGGAETAMVIARGANASTGEPQLLIIEFVQEGGLWKVTAGLQTGDAMPQG